jgi:hypothetical protein
MVAAGDTRPVADILRAAERLQAVVVGVRLKVGPPRRVAADGVLQVEHLQAVVVMVGRRQVVEHLRAVVVMGHQEGDNLRAVAVMAHLRVARLQAAVAAGDNPRAALRAWVLRAWVLMHLRPVVVVMDRLRAKWVAGWEDNASLLMVKAASCSASYCFIEQYRSSSATSSYSL